LYLSGKETGRIVPLRKIYGKRVPAQGRRMAIRTGRNPDQLRVLMATERVG